MSDKLEILKAELRQYESILVAYSGGVDSTLLLKVARDTLPSCKILAVTERSPFIPTAEVEFAKNIANFLDVPHLVIEGNPLREPKIASNPKDRCYWCKKALFSKLTSIAKANNLNCIVDGTNFDDMKDVRPGLKACKEYNVYSPLKKVKLTKKDIRKISKQYGLPTWDKPSFACLASRFPYGEKITDEKLKVVELAEECLLKLGRSICPLHQGFKEVRVRHHDDIARIEIDKKGMKFLTSSVVREKIVKEFKKLGYTYITFDLEGYRTGSMNL